MHGLAYVCVFYLLRLSLLESFCLKMGRYCAVVRCKSRSHDHLNRKLENGIRFFSLPAVKEGQGSKVLDITTRRRRAWVAAIGRATIKFESKQKVFVCSRHFLTGKPAYEMFTNDPDWAPSLKMGHEELKQDARGFKRLREWKNMKRSLAMDRARQFSDAATVRGRGAELSHLQESAGSHGVKQEVTEAADPTPALEAISIKK
ncbi:uncharacterized protein LOC108680962, partial [Hyalella azteca]|uniref:Uncharacterized protein LOC108680962 n=1 Tax=Hyalella azteca TaxID=294128 RepID=A0A8B7PGV8_HYAAZ